MWRSTDGGNDWVAASAPLSSDDDGASFVAVDPNDSNTAYFGTIVSGRVYSTSTALAADSTTAWTPVQVRGPIGYISSISFDPNLPDRVYATSSSFLEFSGDAQIYRSDDRGKTWTAVGNGPNQLPDIPVNALLVDPDQSSTLYIGTDIGVFASFDGGDTWTQGGAPFADAITYSMQIHNENGVKTLWVFTYGRGVWRLNLSGVASPCTFSLSSDALSVTGDETLGSLQVLTEPGCTWSASPGASFAAIQSPAVGVGLGPVFYNIAFNAPTPNGDSPARTDTFYVQGIPVTVNQSAGQIDSTVNDTISSARIIGALPYSDFQFAVMGLTNSPSDPIHSCTGSADKLPAWWTFSAQQAGTLMATASARAQSFLGDAGIVISAYALNNGVLGKELACKAIPQNMNFFVAANGTPGSIIFPVQTGSQYAIEIAATTTEVPYAEYLGVASLAHVTVTPSAPSLQQGQRLQFFAAVAAPPNTPASVRWSIFPPQFGRITPSGLYTAPVTVNQTTPVTVTATSSANSAAWGTATMTLQPPASEGPSIGAVVNGASFASAGIVPGEIATIFGSNLTSSSGINLTAGLPLPTAFQNVTVMVNGLPAPLFAVDNVNGQQQINFQVPFGVSEPSANIAVVNNTSTGPTIAVPVVAAHPGVFNYSAGGLAFGSILHADFQLADSGHPVVAGEIVLIYCTGLGAVSAPPAAGAAGNGQATIAEPIVTIGGANATVSFSGLAPGYVGLYQINAQIPAGLNSGNQPVVIAMAGASSNSVLLPVD